MSARSTPSALGGTGSDAPDPLLETALLDAAVAAGMAVNGIAKLHRLSGGASKEMWGFEVALGAGRTQSLVLRRQPPGRALSGYGLDSVAREAAIIRLADAAGVPVPAVAFELPPGSPAGDGYAMAHVAGETMGSRVLRLPELAAAREGLAYRCGEVLARLHGAGGGEHLGLPSRGAREALARLAERHRETAQDRPVFDHALAWLSANLPDETTRVLCHGDFRTGNLVIGPDGLRAVLDWELAHIGPPAADLAWLCVPSWRFQRPELPVGGFGTREALLAGYAAAGGAPIDPAELFAWEVFGTLNWGVMCAGAGRAFMDGARSVEGAVIARRASETEFDLMRLLAPDHPAWASVDAQARRFDDPPFDAIIDEVEAATRAGIAPGFAQKVADNALGIAERERAAKLRPVGDSDAVEALILDCLGKLAVDQPGYPGFVAFFGP